MKTMKRTLGLFLALLFLAVVPVTALAAQYNMENGGIYVYATEDGQTVQQGNVAPVEDSAPVITGSASETSEYGGEVNVHSMEGATANLTLKDVSGTSLKVLGDGNAVITVEGDNTFDTPWMSGAASIDMYNGTTTLEGSGTLNGTAGIDLNAAEVIVDGPTVIGTAEEMGVWIFPKYNRETTAVTVNSGDLIGVATPLEEENGEESSGDGIWTAGIWVDPGATLNVNGGTVTGVNETGEEIGRNPGIGLEEGAELNIADGLYVYDGEGNDITAEVQADPTVLNDIAEATITEVKIPPERELFTVSGQDITFIFYNHLGYLARLADGRVDRGTYKVVDGKIVLRSLAGAEMTVGEKGELTYIFANNKDMTYQVTLGESDMATIRGIFG